MDVERATGVVWPSLGTAPDRCGAGAYWAAVGQRLHRAGVALRRGGSPARPASTQQIVELRDQGLTWTDVAEHVKYDCFRCLEPHRKALPPQPPRLGRLQLRRQARRQAWQIVGSLVAAAGEVDFSGKPSTRSSPTL
jgi:hypothetical protein